MHPMPSARLAIVLRPDITIDIKPEIIKTDLLRWIFLFLVLKIVGARWQTPLQQSVLAGFDSSMGSNRTVTQEVSALALNHPARVLDANFLSMDSLQTQECLCQLPPCPLFFSKLYHICQPQGCKPLQPA